MRTVGRERVRVVCGRVAPVCASRNVNYRMKPEAGWIRRANRKEAPLAERNRFHTLKKERVGGGREMLMNEALLF